LKQRKALLLLLLLALSAQPRLKSLPISRDLTRTWWDRERGRERERGKRRERRGERDSERGKERERGRERQRGGWDLDDSSNVSTHLVVSSEVHVKLRPTNSFCIMAAKRVTNEMTHKKRVTNDT